MSLFSMSPFSMSPFSKTRKSLRRLFWLLPLSLIPRQARADDWVYLDNGTLRLGVDKASGACLGWLSQSKTTRNLLNHFDRGRFVQQSYYGDADGSKWGANPWTYNPVQGGEYRGKPSELKEFRTRKTTLYAKVTPRHWAEGSLLSEVTMEEWIELKQNVAHIRFKVTYDGAKTHDPHQQEIPAIFVDSGLATLITYDGDSPWRQAAVTRRVPGWPNQSLKMKENWVAYVDDDDFGVGAYVPIAAEATCYRYKGSGGADDCSYVAPLTTFALTPKRVFAYDLYLTLGKADEIRSTFTRLHDSRHEQPKTTPHEKK